MIFALGLMVCLVEVSSAAPMGTAFTYQGRLVEDNNAPTGTYDFEFKLFDDPCTGMQQGSTIEVTDLDVIDGYFTLELDFGANIFTGTGRWLEIGIRPGGSSGSLTILSPRQEITPAPYALYAATGAWRHTEASYIIFKRGSDVLAQDGKDGSLLFTEGAKDATSVINKAIEQTALEGGGMIFIKPGEYELTGRLDIIGQENITIMGTDGTILTDPCAGTAMLIDEDSNNITLNRLTFRDCNDICLNIKDCNNIRILNCVFDDIADHAIQVRIADDPERPVENLRISGCYLRGAGSSGTASLHVYRAKNLFIQNNLFEDCGGGAINVQRVSERVICSDNIVRNNGFVAGEGPGIYIGSSSAYVTIRGNIVTGNAGLGLEAASGSMYSIKDNDGNVIERGPRAPLYVITDNIFVENGVLTGKHGIWITGRDHVVSNNLCLENGGSGIRVGYANDSSRIVIQGNVVGNNGSGITVADEISALPNPPEDQLLVIRDNLIYNDPNSNQTRAIYCGTGADGILIEGNRVEGHDKPQIAWDPAADHIIVRGNPGFRTEAFDIVTETFVADTNGVVYVDLADYLDDVNEGIVVIDPNLFRVTPRATSGGGYSGGYFNYWVDQISDTNMGIYWDSGVARTEVGFNWIYGKP